MDKYSTPLESSVCEFKGMSECTYIYRHNYREVEEDEEGEELKKY